MRAIRFDQEIGQQSDRLAVGERDRPDGRCSICKRPSKEKMNADKVVETNGGLMADG
jgi:hypothetical protein